MVCVSFHVLPDLSKPNQYLIFGLILCNIFKHFCHCIHLFKKCKDFIHCIQKTHGLKLKLENVEKSVSSGGWEDKTIPESC